MAQLYKPHEVTVAPFFKNGVTLDFYLITFPNLNLNTATENMVNAFGAREYGADITEATPENARNPLTVALEAIQARTSIEIVGAVTAGTTSSVKVAVASLGGAYGSDDYNKDGSPVTFATYLTSVVHATRTAVSGDTYQGYDMTNVTVTSTTF